jgi:DNA uptake protein ComE-like DNA-binding protein
VRLTGVICAIAVFAAGDLPAVQKEWVTLENCEFVPNPANDGDSFHVRIADKEYLIRLYLVDAPETEAVNPARLIEQAQYFGVSVPQVIEIGEAATSFVRSKLAEPFTVYTHMAGGMGRSKIERFYGFVRTKDGDLGEQLVANGLARIHGMRGTPPGASSSAEAIQKLEELEQRAKQQKVGGWAGNSAKLQASQQQEPKSNPTKLVEQSTAKPAIRNATASPQAKDTTARMVAPLPQRQDAKLDVNIASPEELQEIPGIGPGIAQRIIEARPFKSADDLQKVKGIGAGAKYGKIRPYFN